MLSLSLLAGCSDYKLSEIFKGEGEDTGLPPEEIDTGIPSDPAPDYPIEQLVVDCMALTADVCPDNDAEADDDEDGGIDSFCYSWVTPRAESLDNAATAMIDDLNNGVTGIGVYSIFQARVPSHNSGTDADGETNSAAMALIPGSEDEIRDAIVAWEATHVSRDDLDEFPLNAIVCRVSVSEYEDGDVTAQFIQGHQDEGAPSNDIGDAIIANVSDAPASGSVSLGVQPEFAPEDSTTYQYLEDESPYDIERGMDEVTDASYAFLTTAAFFAEVDESDPNQETYSTLKHYGVE